MPLYNLTLPICLHSDIESHTLTLSIELETCPTEEDWQKIVRDLQESLEHIPDFPTLVDEEKESTAEYYHSVFGLNEITISITDVQEY